MPSGSPTPIDILKLANPAPKITNPTLAGILTGGAGFNLFDLIFFMIGAFFLGSLMFAAVRYVTSEGDPKKISEATTRVVNSIVGLVIVFASFLIVKIVASIFGYGVGGGANNILPF